MKMIGYLAIIALVALIIGLCGAWINGIRMYSATLDRHMTLKVTKVMVDWTLSRGYVTTVESFPYGEDDALEFWGDVGDKFVVGETFKVTYRIWYKSWIEGTKLYLVNATIIP